MSTGHLDTRIHGKRSLYLVIDVCMYQEEIKLITSTLI